MKIQSWKNKHKIKIEIKQKLNNKKIYCIMLKKKEKNIHAQLKKINENKVEIKKKKVLKKKN